MKYYLCVFVTVFILFSNANAQLGFGFTYSHRDEAEDEYGQFHIYTIDHVFKKSPAEKAGLKPGDIIIKFNDAILQLVNEIAIANIIKTAPLTNELVIERSKIKQTITVTKEDRGAYLNICLQGNCVNGNGNFVDKDGMEYTGAFKNGKKEGKGKSASLNGYTYEGNWNNDKKEGWGKMNFKAPPSSFLYKDWLYEGEWENDSMCGKGKAAYYAGAYYIGDFKSNVRSGNGKLVLKDSTVYEGEWVNDKLNGKGSISFANGDRHTGNFINGEMEGEASAYTKATNSTATVIYKKGKLQK